MRAGLHHILIYKKNHTASRSHMTELLSITCVHKFTATLSLSSKKTFSYLHIKDYFAKNVVTKNSVCACDS